MAEVHFGGNINEDIKVKKIKDPKTTKAEKGSKTSEPPKVDEKPKAIVVKEPELRCMACKKTAKQCGYDPNTNPVENIQTYYIGKFVCEKCWEKAGYPLGNGEDLLHRILILLDIPLVE
jgi:hypothetical protein